MPSTIERCPGGCGELYEDWVRFCWRCKAYTSDIMGHLAAGFNQADAARMARETWARGQKDPRLVPDPVLRHSTTTATAPVAPLARQAPAPASNSPAKPPLEEELRLEVLGYLRGHGIPVASYEQGYRPFKCKSCQSPIPGGSRVTLGVPDLLVLAPGEGFFVELKRATRSARRTEEQEKFREDATLAGIVVRLWRTIEECHTWHHAYLSRRMTP